MKHFNGKIIGVRKKIVWLMNCPMGLKTIKPLDYYLSFFHKVTNECKVIAELSNSY